MIYIIFLLYIYNILLKAIKQNNKNKTQIHVLLINYKKNQQKKPQHHERTT